MHPAVVGFRSRWVQCVALTLWLSVVPLSAHAQGSSGAESQPIYASFKATAARAYN